MYHLVVYWPIYAKKLISIVDPLKVPFRLTGHKCIYFDVYWMKNRPMPIFQLKFCQSQWYSKVKLWRHFSILWLPISVFEGVLLPLRILKCSSYHIQIVIKQEYAFWNFRYRFDKWRWRKLTFWRNTIMHWSIILKTMPKCFVWGVHIRIDMAFIDIHRTCLSNGRCLKSSNCN